MGTIKCGFWKLGFILSPDEFKNFIEFCKSLRIMPYEDENELFSQYQIYYNGLIATTPPAKLLQNGNISHISLKSFGCCNLQPDNAIGFIINPANMVHWAYYRGAVRINSWAVQITLQKSVSIDKEDEKGKYFEYEDIQLHSPQSYSLYQQVTTYIKNTTKPMRFMAHVIDELEEIKPPVRISKKVAEDLSNSWIFKNYEFEMRSYDLYKL